MDGVEGKTENDQHICKLIQMAVVEYQVICLPLSRPSQGQPDPAHREKSTQNYIGSWAQAVMYNGFSAEEQCEC